jgi:Ca-activated chloride channel family protein
MRHRIHLILGILAVGFALAVFGCAEADTNTSDRDNYWADLPSDGDELADGDDQHAWTDGDSIIDGDNPSSLDGDEPTNGDNRPDGDMPDGDSPDGDTPDGDNPGIDGDTTSDGDVPDGDVLDGDVIDGDLPDGDVIDGDQTEGESSDGDSDQDFDEEVEIELPEYICPEEQVPYRMYLSSDDSNSVASPVIMRGSVTNRYSYDRSRVRMWEFLNYYRIPYPTPASGETLAAYADMAPADEPGAFTLQVAARSFDLATRAGRPMNLTFILDTSGSMADQPIEFLRRICRTIAGQLNSGDRVSMVNWSTTQNILLENHQVSGPNDTQLINAINGLRANGGTDLHAGLQAGYSLAEEMFDAEANNRVILISDGEANAGVTDLDMISLAADDRNGEGIYMVGVAVGSSFNDRLMESVTDAGRGAYLYIDSLEEAELMFSTRFYENMEIAARAVRVEVTLPWYFQMKDFHGEEWSQNPSEVEPQHLAPNDSMVFHQVVQACDPELVNPEDEITIKIDYADPQTLQRKSVIKTVKISDIMHERAAFDNESFAYTGFAKTDSLRLNKGNAIVAYAKLLQSPREKAEELKLEASKLKDAFESLADETLDDDFQEMADVLSAWLR